MYQYVIKFNKNVAVTSDQFSIKTSFKRLSC